MATYTEITDSDIDVNSPLDTDLFSAFRDNQRALRFSLFGYVFAEATNTSTGYTTFATGDVFVPDFGTYSGQTNTITVRFQGKISSGDANFRLQDSDSGNTGSEITVSQTTYLNSEVSIGVDASWYGTRRTLLLEGKSSAGGTVAAKNNTGVATSSVEW